MQKELRARSFSSLWTVLYWNKCAFVANTRILVLFYSNFTETNAIRLNFTQIFEQKMASGASAYNFSGQQRRQALTTIRLCSVVQYR